MSKIKVIGLTGIKRSGKDTVGKIIKKYYTKKNIYVRKYMLAQLIKDTLCSLTGYSLTGIELVKDNSIVKEPEFTYRDALIAFADRYKEKYGIDVHYKYTKNKILRDKPKVAIITDIRYPFEAQLFINDFDTTIIKVVRPGIEVDTSHSSETSIDAIYPDYEIINDGTVKDLEKKVIEVLKEINV